MAVEVQSVEGQDWRCRVCGERWHDHGLGGNCVRPPARPPRDPGA